MGDPKFPRRKYDTPSHPWQADRIKEENDLIHKYGLKNKREVWKVKSMLARFRQQARMLLARLRTGDEQAMREKDELLSRLNSLGILEKDAQLDDVLAMNVENILARRLQTVIYMKGLAFTPRQARQFIIHGHIAVSGKKVTIPSYMTKRKEEDFIEYYDNSVLNDSDHPMVPKTAYEETDTGQVKGKIDLSEKGPEKDTKKDAKKDDKKDAKKDAKKDDKKDVKKEDKKEPKKETESAKKDAKKEPKKETESAKKDAKKEPKKETESAKKEPKKEPKKETESAKKEK